MLLIHPVPCLPSMILIHDASFLPSMFLMHDLCLPLTLILKLSSDCPPLHIPLPFALFLNSHVFYCFIHFDFLHILANNEKELLVVSHVFFNPQHCSSILSCFTYQKSINFLHKSVKQCVSRLSHKYTSINLCKNTRQCCRTNKVTLVSIGDVGYARTRYHTNKVTLVSMVDGG